MSKEPDSIPLGEVRKHAAQLAATAKVEAASWRREGQLLIARAEQLETAAEQLRGLVFSRLPSEDDITCGALAVGVLRNPVERP